jgi:hypothetical protein
MKIAGLFLAFATVVAVGPVAHATDAVVPDPLQAMEPQSINACASYGTGFALIPGTQTCIRVGGQVRFDQSLSSGGRSGERSRGGTTLGFETRSD